MERTWYLIVVNVANALATKTHYFFSNKDEIKAILVHFEDVEEIIELSKDGTAKKLGKKID